MEDITADTSIDSSLAETGFFQRWCRQTLFAQLKKLNRGYLVIEDAQGSHCFGHPRDKNSLHAHISIHDMSAYRKILFGGSIGAGEAFMHGEWSSPCLVSVVQIMASNLKVTKSMGRGWSWLNAGINKCAHLLNANSLSGSKKNISAHYDLGNDFFRLFLDPTLMYSAAIFPTEDCGLDVAALHKLETVCQKLKLTEEDHLLEIGTGWGGMAIYAAKNYGCRVTTTTLSKEQFEHAKAAVRDAGLEDQVTLLLKDYRELHGCFDKLVSIEMIEAVGHEYYDTYFRKCSSLLAPDGLMVIQAITISDQRYHTAKSSVDFIQKYIFPGGGLPSNEVMTSGVRRCTDMMVVDLHDIGWDYAQTIYHWRERFHHQLEQVKSQGFDEVFCRMWDFYLAYCEGGFKERAISTVQLVMAKPYAKSLPRRG
ncbi:MAG: class I SAM-dependent methyltransferase [Cellvibrionaceae bacterium]